MQPETASLRGLRLSDQCWRGTGKGCAGTPPLPGKRSGDLAVGKCRLTTKAHFSGCCPRRAIHASVAVRENRPSCSDRPTRSNRPRVRREAERRRPVSGTKPIKPRHGSSSGRNAAPLPPVSAKRRVVRNRDSSPRSSRAQVVSVREPAARCGCSRFSALRRAAAPAAQGRRGHAAPGLTREV